MNTKSIHRRRAYMKNWLFTTCASAERSFHKYIYIDLQYSYDLSIHFSKYAWHNFWCDFMFLIINHLNYDKHVLSYLGINVIWTRS